MPRGDKSGYTDKQSSIRDPDLKTLCRRIIAGQQAEIDQMNALLRRYPR